MGKKIEDLLIEMGIYPNLLGFGYICRAVAYITEDSSVKTCELYEMVAKDYVTTASRVERAMRTAFYNADEESEAYKKYIGIKHSCNSKMLYTFANKLKRS